MKTNFYFLLSVALLILFAASSANASHVAGGEISYRWLGGNTYRIIFTIYRDCAGIPAPTTLEVKIVSACGDSIPVTAIPVPGTGTIINPTCPSAPNTCQGGSSPGIEKWQYYIDYLLPHACSDWRFSLSEPVRNAAITIFSAPLYSLYQDAHLDNSSFNHDSPFFTSDPALFACINNDDSIDCSVMDHACDSVAYLLTCAKNGLNACIPYFAGYDSIHFISSTPAPLLDAFSGMLYIHPNLIEVGVYVVLVKQFRNGILIGSITRDILLYVPNCIADTNYLPQISGINGTNQHSIIFPANKISCFTIFSSDSDSAQTTKLAINVPISGATFTTDTLLNQSGIFCWQPLISDTGACPHCFSVRVNDDHCNVEGQSFSVYCITVVDSGYQLSVNNIVSKQKITVTVSPNSFSKSATVTLSPASNLLRWQFTLFDAFGRTVMSKWNEGNSMAIDAGDFSAGVYVYSIRNDDQILSNGKILITQ